MASMEVVVSICDRCTTEVTAPLHRTGRWKNRGIVLPPGWLHVAGNTATALVFEMDLCDECKQIVMEVAGKARRVVHSTGSKAKGKQDASAKKAVSEQIADSEQAADSEQDPATDKLDAQPEQQEFVSVN